MVDGAIGMAYGVTGTSVLLSFGIPPATASASIHTAEVFTSGVAGLSHWRFGNIRFSYLWRLALPGMVGGAFGAYILAVSPGDEIRGIINGYLLLMGIWIIGKAWRWRPALTEPVRWITPLGASGGFLDAIGGGGWGLLVTSTLVGRGGTPRYVIGSVSAAEFFVTVTISVTFLSTIGLTLWPIIAGLIVGGVIAAPFAAYVTKTLPARPLMVLVGVAVIVLSVRGLTLALNLF